MSLIDFWGYRIIARALIPGLKKETWLYGSCDGGITVHKDESSSIVKKIDEIGEYLGLKSSFPS